MLRCLGVGSEWRHGGHRRRSAKSAAVHRRWRSCALRVRADRGGSRQMSVAVLLACWPPAIMPHSKKLTTRLMLFSSQSRNGCQQLRRLLKRHAAGGNNPAMHPHARVNLALCSPRRLTAQLQPPATPADGTRLAPCGTCKPAHLTPSLQVAQAAQQTRRRRTTHPPPRPRRALCTDRRARTGGGAPTRKSRSAWTRRPPP